ncbi:MAG: response regulator [Marinifilaceae bacterium]
MEKHTDQVLIVDDIPENIQVLESLLSEEGFGTSFATSGEEALRLVKNSDFDLILLDAMLPGLDGNEICRELRNQREHRSLPVVFMMAPITQEDINRGKKTEGDDYITKPLNSGDWLARIRTHLNLKKECELLSEQNRNLVEKVEEGQRELRKAHKRLSRLEKSKSDFLSLISHELRTPLTGVVGFVEMLYNTNLNKEQQEYLKYLKDSSKRLMHFTETATLFTCLQMEDFVLKPTRVKIKPLLLNSLNQYADEIREQGIRIQNWVESNNISVWGDEELLQIACNCILENAIKYCPGSNGCIWFYVGREDEKVKLGLRDNGKGFSQKILETEYETFSCDDVMKHHQGYGLGLSTVKLIMDIHGAKVKLENHPIGGGIVEISFPSDM